MTKRTFAILAILCLLCTIKSYSQSVTLNVRNTPLEKVFAEIEKQTGYGFIFSKTMLANAKNVTLNINNSPIESALDLCLRSQPLSFAVVDKYIIINSPSSGDQRPAPSAPPQRAVTGVKGKVSDSKGAALVGVTIKLEGAVTQTKSTDATGNYYFSNVPAGNYVLLFSFVGFAKTSRKITLTEGQEKELNISLAEEISKLSQVVVIGYGTQKKSTLTGSVGSVSAKNIEGLIIASPDNAIKGQVAGVYVAQRSGAPGGGLTIRVRGTGSIGAGNEPLYVIDGFPVEGSYDQDFNPLVSINPTDIESIEILKDASAASIYGSRGGNGVILITTKKGKAGKPIFKFDMYHGFQQAANTIDMMNAREYAEYNTEARNNQWVDRGGKASDPNSVRDADVQIPPMFSNPSSLGEGTDWQDAVLRTAHINNYQLSVSGGTQQTQYFISGGYFKEDGVVIHTGFERYTARFNLNATLSEKLKLGINVTPSYTRNKILPVDGQQYTNGILASALAMPPNIPVYNADGSFTSMMEPTPYGLGVIENPVAIAQKTKNNRTTFRTLGTTFAELSIVQGLTFKATLGADYTDAIYNTYSPTDLGNGGVAPPLPARATAGTDRTLTWLSENTLTYDKVFRNDHRFTALLGFSSQKSHTESSYMAASNFPNDLVPTLNAGQVTQGETYANEWSLLSYLGRLNYSYKNKYLFTATFRRDGSSRFGSDNKWGNFPSTSAGWIISEEEFFKKQPLIGYLKLRAGYGQAGNNNIGNYNHIGTLFSSRYVFGPNGGTVVNGLSPAAIPNPLLGWEISNQLDIGIDIGLLNNRVSLTIDYYSRKTSDLLLEVPVPASTGFSTALQNIGKINNKGWEFTLETKNLVDAFKWNTDFNISFNKNKVLALGPSGAPLIVGTPGYPVIGHITRLGLPMSIFWGYDAIGVFRDQADVDKGPAFDDTKPGDLKFRDVNGDGEITTDDITTIGTPHPDFIYGMTNTFSYKNFSLSILVEGSQGGQLLNWTPRNIGFVNGGFARRDRLNRWQSPEQPGDGKIPRANISVNPGNTRLVSSFLIEDASFFRVRNIYLKYQFPQKMLKNIFLTDAGIYLSVQNAFTITRYKGYNPEQSSGNATALALGADFNGYPIARVFTVGFNLTF